MKTLVQETFENEFNEAHYKEFVKNLFNHFDFSKEHTLKHQFNDAERQALNDFTYFGTYEDAEKKCLDVLTVELKSSSKVERARSLQRNLIGKYLKTNLKDSALVAFYSKDNPDWRLSFVKMDYRLDERGVKVEIGTPPKRYSFLVGKTEPSHTAQKQLMPLLDDRKAPTLDEIEKSFSIEKVTKEFYTEIAKKFTELVGGERKIGSKKIVEAGQLKYPKPSDTLRKEFAVRLIGRLMFCWFLKKKKSEGGVSLIPNVLLSSDAISQYPDYYHSLLEPLFFQVLNTPVEKRNKSVRHSFWNNVPFLNGGLFEPHLYDYYEIYYESGLSKYINTLKVPDSWFLDLFKIFEIYNFTIDESTSIDIDISVDPEMLGRIFENLLAEINPETGETARKSTGSYYTPRPIVEYMVDESLKQYLLTQIQSGKDVIPACRESLRKKDSGQARMTEKLEHGYFQVNDKNEIETKLSRLLSYGDWEIDLTETEKDSIIDALDRAKIIDPACGSGAFPMGILHKMLLILQKIDPESKQWLFKKLARIDNEILRKEVEKKLKTENWDYIHKLGIIQNSVYGVDIQPIAVEISKLRFFLSLIVDEKIDDDKPNRGVVPLPNLEFKFVAANSLIGLPKAEGGLAESHKDIEKLKEFRDAYFTSYGDEKRNIEEQFKETQRRMFLHALNWQATGSQTYKLSEWNPFSDEASSWFDPEWMFGVRDGFDIVIANPPYGANIDSALSILYPIYTEVIQNYAEIYKMFFQCGMSMLNNNGMLSFITPNTYLSQPRYKDLRKFMLRFNIVRIINLGEGVFEGVVPVCLTFLRNKFPETSYFFADVSERSKFTGNLSNSRFLEIPLARVHSFKDLSLYFTDELRNNQVYFDAALEIKDAGIQYHRTGIGLKKKGGNDLYERLFSNHKAFQEARPVWYGKLINRYYMAERTDEYFNLNYRDVLRDKESVSFTIEAFKVTPKIIWRQTAPCLQATIDKQCRWFRNTIQCAYIKPLYRDRLNIKYVLAVCNSKYIASVYNKLVKESGRVFPQVKITHVKKLPLVIASKGIQEEIASYVSKILSLKQKDLHADTSALERQIDKMVYELYELMPEEIDIVEGVNANK